jgi:hypothetical protein
MSLTDRRRQTVHRNDPFYGMQDASVRDMLNRCRGKAVTLMLSGGQTVSGTLVDHDEIKPQTRLVHLAEVVGHDHFDGVVSVAAIAALLVRRPDPTARKGVLTHMEFEAARQAGPEKNVRDFKERIAEVGLDIVFDLDWQAVPSTSAALDSITSLIRGLTNALVRLNRDPMGHEAIGSKMRTVRVAHDADAEEKRHCKVTLEDGTLTVAADLATFTYKAHDRDQKPLSDLIASLL